MKLLRESLPRIISTLISTIILAFLGCIIFNFNIAIITGLYLLLLVVAIYVIFSRQQSKINPNIFLPRFSKRIRLFIVIILIISTIFIFQFIRSYSSPYTIPDLQIKIINNGSNEIPIYDRGEFFLTVPETPLSDTIVASGRIKLKKFDDNSLYQTELVIPPKGELIVYAQVINPVEYRIFFERENADMRLILNQKNGKTLSRSGIPFDRNTFSNFCLVFETQTIKTPVSSPQDETNITKVE
jgi:amino acid transporter